ncbi:hypothetical protein MIMGU_mgv1a027137mg [Erythranthe guttata]|uniref:Pectinesterase inhibitor domain-containing protein n=1 Tax=Erythranthe guttata TaxID=4155 RepID=A0A022QLS2_ERYGU|nr:PREDICTED: dentin sialophosphoprotein [Erythranthe guttata]EYU29652.1 hypothetical protein MIMGU_mgv1a027137mg [Erythranthe guttata]|eukprot:XP_012846602.1 PREDICTED: dentin sialophosphoprotein [Erythranthe guttata]
MAIHNTLSLLILSFSLLIASHSAQPELSPAASPTAQSPRASSAGPTDDGTAPSPSPSYGSFPPSTISDPPSTSISPSAADPPAVAATLITSTSFDNDDEAPAKPESPDGEYEALAKPESPDESSDSDDSEDDDDDEAPAKPESPDESSNDDNDGGAPAKLNSFSTSSNDDDGPGAAKLDSFSTSSNDDDGPGAAKLDSFSTSSNDGAGPAKLDSLAAPSFDLSSILDTSAPTDDVDPKVKKICDSTDHSSLCLTTIAPLLKGKDDVPSVLEVSIGVGSKLSDYALSLAKTMSEKPGMPPQVLSVIKDCKDSYDTAAYNYQNAVDALHEKDIGTMNSMLSAVITNVGDCEDGFSSIGETSVFSGLAENLTNVTSNCLAIISLLG